MKIDTIALLIDGIDDMAVTSTGHDVTVKFGHVEFILPEHTAHLLRYQLGRALGLTPAGVA